MIRLLLVAVLTIGVLLAAAPPAAAQGCSIGPLSLFCGSSTGDNTSCTRIGTVYNYCNTRVDGDSYRGTLTTGTSVTGSRFTGVAESGSSITCTGGSLGGIFDGCR